MKNYYQILGLDEKADETQIKKAFRMYATKIHPDKHNGDIFFENLFREVKEAYEVLSDPVQKSQYDASFFKQHQISEQIQALKSWEYALKQKEMELLRHEQESQWELEEKQKLRVVQYVFFGLVFMVLLYLLGYALSRASRSFSRSAVPAPVFWHYTDLSSTFSVKKPKETLILWAKENTIV